MANIIFTDCMLFEIINLVTARVDACMMLIVFFFFFFFKLVIQVMYIVNPEEGDSGRTGCRDKFSMLS